MKQQTNISWAGTISGTQYIARGTARLRWIVKRMIKRNKMHGAARSFLEELSYAMYSRNGGQLFSRQILITKRYLFVRSSVRCLTARRCNSSHHDKVHYPSIEIANYRFSSSTFIFLVSTYTIPFTKSDLSIRRKRKLQCSEYIAFR